jgi:hypothetical protein
MNAVPAAREERFLPVIAVTPGRRVAASLTLVVGALHVDPLLAKPL